MSSYKVKQEDLIISEHSLGLTIHHIPSKTTVSSTLTPNQALKSLHSLHAELIQKLNESINRKLGVNCKPNIRLMDISGQTLFVTYMEMLLFSSELYAWSNGFDIEYLPFNSINPKYSAFHIESSGCTLHKNAHYRIKPVKINIGEVCSYNDKHYVVLEVHEYYVLALVDSLIETEKVPWDERRDLKVIAPNLRTYFTTGPMEGE